MTLTWYYEYTMRMSKCQKVFKSWKNYADRALSSKAGRIVKSIRITSACLNARSKSIEDPCPHGPQHPTHNPPLYRKSRPGPKKSCRPGQQEPLPNGTKTDSLDSCLVIDFEPTSSHNLKKIWVFFWNGRHNVALDMKLTLAGLCLMMSKWAMDDHFPY